MKDCLTAAAARRLFLLVCNNRRCNDPSCCPPPAGGGPGHARIDTHRRNASAAVSPVRRPPLWLEHDDPAEPCPGDGCDQWIEPGEPKAKLSNGRVVCFDCADSAETTAAP